MKAEKMAPLVLHVVFALSLACAFLLGVLAGPSLVDGVDAQTAKKRVTEAVRTAPRSPCQNAYVERLIGSIRRECLDHVIVCSAGGLHRILSHYVVYYMRSRTHLVLGKNAPTSHPATPPSAGRIVPTPQVGGLHHRYDRAAA